MRTYRAPATCPVCSDSLITLRVGCPSCGTELSGHFGQCRFCSLDTSDLAILEVFLRSRGNLRDVQAHLGVSYPTARQRLSDLLNRLGYTEVPAAAAAAGPPVRPGQATPALGAESAMRTPARPAVGDVLADLAAGRLDVDQAAGLLEPRTGPAGAQLANP